MHALAKKLPILPPPQRSRRERRANASRKPVLHVVMPGMEVARAEIKPRETITGFLRRVGWATKDKVYGWQFKKGLPTILEINGESVLRKNWRTRRIAANDNVRFVSFPLGGNGSSGAKQVIGLVALVAVAAFALWAGPALFGAAGALFTGSTLTGQIATAVIGLGGALLVNALTAPKAGATNNPNSTQDQIYTAQVSGNTAKIGQPLPVWNGKFKNFPDFAATPWGEFVANDQYLNVLLSTTMGSLDYDSIYVDQTLLWDSVNGIDNNFTAQVEFYEPGETVTLFPVNVDSSIEVTGQEFPDGTGDINFSNGVPGAFLGPFVTNPPGTLAQSIAVDFVFPAGCYSQKTGPDADGKYLNQSFRLNAQYAPVNDAGALIGSFTTLFDITRTYNSNSPIRDSIKIDVTPGRYTVQVQRGDQSNIFGASTCVWAGLRSFLKGANSFPDVSTVAIRLLASQSTQGSFKFGVLATRKLPVWNGSEFILQATRNPAWAFLDAVTNEQYGSGLPISKVDFNAVVSFAAGCDARGDTFDYIFSTAIAVPAAFDKILTAARTRHFWLGDTVSLVRDEWRDVPSMMLTDREIVRDSTQVTWTMLGDEDPDAVIVEYIDDGTWLPAPVQYPPDSESFIAVNAETKRIDGIVDRSQAFRECAFYYLQSIYRRENVQIDCEYEGRAITFGSVLRLQSELPMAYGYGGAVVGVSGDALTLDPAPVWDTGPFFIRLRMPNGNYFGPVAVTEGAGPTIANLDAASLSAAQTAQGTTLSAVLAREDGAEYPSFELGTGVSESKLCVVLNGVPNGELCTLNLVIDDERVHATDLGTPPILPTSQYPANANSPLIVGLNAMFTQGVAEPKLSASWFPTNGAIYYIADVSFDSGQTWLQVYQGADNNLSEVVTWAALTLRVQAVTDKIRGPYATATLAAPTIVVANQAVALASLISGIQFNVTTAMDQIKATQDQIEQLTAAINSNDIARNWLDKRTLRKEMSSITGTAFAQITELFTVATNTTAALAETETTLQANIDASNARLDTTNTTLADLTSSTSSSITTLNSEFGSVSSSLTSEIVTRSNADNAISAQLTNFIAQTNNSFSSVSNSIIANSSDISALAAAQSTFTTTLNGHTASINSLTGSINGSSIQWGITAVIDGTTGGIAFTGVRTAGGTVFNFVVNGNVVVNGSITGLKVATGTLTAINIASQSLASDTGIFRDLGIETLSIAGNAVTVPVGQAFSNPVLVTNTVQRDIGGFTLSVNTAGDAGRVLRIMVCATCSFSLASFDAIRVQIKSNGVAIAVIDANNSAGGGSNTTGATVGFISWTASGGTDNFVFDVLAASALANVSTVNSATLWVLGAKR